jgi:hypothetical protein
MRTRSSHFETKKRIGCAAITKFPIDPGEKSPVAQIIFSPAGRTFHGGYQARLRDFRQIRIPQSGDVGFKIGQR